MVIWNSSTQRTHNSIVTSKSHCYLALSPWCLWTDTHVCLLGGKSAVVLLKILDISVQNTVTQVNRCLEFCLPLLYWIMRIRILTLKTNYCNYYLVLHIWDSCPHLWYLFQVSCIFNLCLTACVLMNSSHNHLYIFLFMVTYHFLKVRTLCCLLHQNCITHKCCVILKEPNPQLFTHLQYLFMKVMPSWLHAEISGILPFSSSSKCRVQNVHWVIQYTFRMSMFSVYISGCFQSTEIYKFITVPVWILLVQTGIRACLYARDVPSIYQNALRALVILKV